MWRPCDVGAMTEWWTYRPSDFLLFSPRTYYRLFELYNAEVWPLQLLAAGLGRAAVRTPCGAQRRGDAWRARCSRRAGCGWPGPFTGSASAPINWAATWYAAAFTIQAALLIGFAWRGGFQGRRSPIGLGRAAVRAADPADGRRAVRSAVAAGRGVRPGARPHRARHARRAVAAGPRAAGRGCCGRCRCCGAWSAAPRCGRCT